MQTDDLPCIGIDFGTSKCVTTWFDTRTGRAEVLRNAEGEDATPSLVYIGANETLVGRPARDMLDDETERANVILSVKSEISSRKRYAVTGNPTPVEVATRIFAKLKADAENGHFHESVERAVVTHPADFDEVQCDRVLEAAQNAGFVEVELLPEPVAAAVAYANVGLDVGDTVMVYDLGAGTFDLALLARDEEERGGFQVALPPQGRIFGGDNLDRALYDHCDEIAKRSLGRPIALDGTLDLKFLMECRSRKENLSLRDKATFSSYLHDPGGPPKAFRHEVLRADFEELILTELEGTVRATRSLLEQAQDANLLPKSILLIGGSSRVPLVSRLLADALPLPPSQWEKRDVAVALGAAFHAHALWNGGTGQSVSSAHLRQKPLTPEQKTQFTQELLIASEMYRAGSYSAALEVLQRIHKLDPQNETLLQMMGASFSLTKDLPSGIRVFQQLTRAYSDNPYYLQNLGKALEMAQRPDEAVTAYRSSLRLSAETRAKDDLAALLQRLAQERGATPVSTNTVPESMLSAPMNLGAAAPISGIPPVVNRDASAYSLADGNAAMERGDFARAEASFLQALKNRGQTGGFTIFYALGNAQSSQGKWKDAINSYLLALDGSKTPLGTGETIPVMIALVTAYHGAHDYVQAERVCRELKKHEPFRTDVLGLLGVSLAHQPGKEAEAEKVLQDVITRSPTTAVPYIALARILWRTGRPQPAVVILQEAFRNRPQDGLLGAELAEALFQLRDYGGAANVLNKVQRVADSLQAQSVRKKLSEIGFGGGPRVAESAVGGMPSLSEVGAARGPRVAQPAGFVMLRVVVPAVPQLKGQIIHCFIGKQKIGTAMLEAGMDVSTSIAVGTCELYVVNSDKIARFPLTFDRPGAFRAEIPYLRSERNWGKVSVSES